MRYLLLLSTLMPLWGNAQLLIKGDLHPRDTTQIHKLYTKRGDMLEGRLLLIGLDSISFRLNNSQELLRYSFDALDSMQVLPPARKQRSPKKQVYVAERLFIAPSAFSLKKSEKEYRNILLYYNTYHVGITEHTTLGIGVLPAILIDAAWVDVKHTYDISDKLHIGVGASTAIGVIDGSEKTASIGGYGILTLGTRNNFVSASTLRTAARYAGDFVSKPWNFSVGGSFCLTPRLRIFYEIGGHMKYFFDNALVLGITRQGDKRVMDFAIVAFPNRTGLIIPTGFAFTKRF
ncbi:MAG: hypothetical protein GC192_16800 [Bacteroidetes bacterium]|nr:hypothetical protein [Bacteroidota bacterium]